MKMLKTCKVCGEEKPFDPSAKVSSKASGFFGLFCWDCYLEAYREANRKRLATPEGRAQHNAANRKTRSTPEGLEKARKASRAATRKIRSTPAGKEYTARLRRERRCIEIRATPKWSNPQHRAAYYALRDARREFGENVVVDHVVPLRGRNVCGLHCEFNLQVLTFEENAAKSNRHE